MATETQRGRTAEKTKPGAIFREAIKPTTGRATGEAGPQSRRRGGTEISRFFVRASQKIAGRKAAVSSLPAIGRTKNIVVTFAQAGAGMMARLARDIEKALGIGPSPGEIERRKQDAATAEAAYEAAEEMKRYDEFLEQLRRRSETTPAGNRSASLTR